MPAKKTAAKKTIARSPVRSRSPASSTKSAAPKRPPALPKRLPSEPEPPAPAPNRRAGIVHEPEALAVSAAHFADDIKAEDIVVLDVSKVSSITDFFVICTGTSLPHLKAIVRDVRAKMGEKWSVKPGSSEGQSESQWLVLDYGVMMVHAFHRSKRELYSLEDLWSDARVVDWRRS